ncbi:MAG: ribbon-helix-helix domain-containing protein [Candidatus Thorarchaeota archaeon]|nr:ribbon-helix-helix domain-containing protein [Candidatus Thorarchaeota archaeon]
MNHESFFFSQDFIGIVYRHVYSKHKNGIDMGVSSVRLTEDEKAFLERLVKEGRFQSISEALKAGIYEMMREEQLERLPWRTCEEVRSYFTQHKKKLRGLEDDHEED